MAYTKADLFSGIAELGVDKNGVLFIHSSIKSVGDVEGRGDTILDAFIEYMADGLLILPTHTWEYIGPRGGTFDPQTAKSCVGMLPNLFMARPGVIRSLHPTHSMAALGNGSREFVSGEENSLSPCARNGCYGKLLDMGAQILFLGCSLKCNTFLHGVEEWSDVPGRFMDEPAEYTIKLPDSRTIRQSACRHGGPYENVSDNYDKMEKPFLKLGIAREGRIGDARSVLCDARRMYKLVTQYLEKNIQLFADDAPIPEDWY